MKLKMMRCAGGPDETTIARAVHGSSGSGFGDGSGACRVIINQKHEFLDARRIATDRWRPSALLLGTVVDRVTRRPLADVSVVIEQAGCVEIIEVVTTENGVFEFTNLAGGDLRLSATAPGGQVGVTLDVAPGDEWAAQIELAGSDRAELLATVAS